MSFKKDFDIFVGGKSGIFKGIKIDEKACITKNIQNLMSIRTEHEVTAMSWSDESEREILLGCGSKTDRSVKIYNTEDVSFTATFKCDGGTGNIKGLSQYNDMIITAVESGHIKLWRFDEGDQIGLEAGENLERMRHSTVNKNIIATGGKEHKLKFFDLETQTKIFEEKNVRNDWLELRVPLWISDIGFLPHSSQVATCSRYGHVRLYDPDAQRRPVISLEMKDEALITLAISPRENHIVVGSGRGVMKLIDLRKPGRILNTYKDFVGSITSIACTRSNPYIVSVGLDRFLRIHHLDTKALLKKLYLTSRLSCMVLRSDFTMDSIDPKEETGEKIGKRSLEQNENGGDIDIADGSSSEAEYDQMFDAMPIINNEENEAELFVKSTKRETKNLNKHNAKVSKTSLQAKRKKLKNSNGTSTIN